MGRKLTKYLVLHCAATPEGAYFDGKDITRWHLEERGWKQVGYRDLILLDGKVQNLVKNNNDDYVDSWEITNGVFGFNSESEHICYIGGLDATTFKPKDTRTPQQLETMKNYVLEYVRCHPHVQVVGHYQLDSKKPYCPGFNVPAWLRGIGVPEKNIKE